MLRAAHDQDKEKFKVAGVYMVQPGLQVLQSAQHKLGVLHAEQEVFRP